MQIPIPTDARARPLWRALLSYYVANGAAAALGLLLISGAVHLVFGPVASASASVGIICCIPPDQAAPKRGKFWHLLPALVVGVPLFLAVRLLHASPLALGLLLVPATFCAFLGAAWGKRGLPIAVSAMFALVFALAVTQHGAQGTPLSSTLAFAGGAAAYLLWATAANLLLNARYRVQMLADTLYAAAGLMRAQAAQFLAAAATPTRPLGEILRRQAALADQLQAARDILLESPRTPQRQRLAGILMQVLDLRDHLLACELDLDAVQDRHEHDDTLAALQALLRALADDVDALGDALLAGRLPAPQARREPPRPPLESGADGAATPSALLARALSGRVGHVESEVARMVALARGEAEPDLALVRVVWQMFVSPADWSWRPLRKAWHWNAPPLRHALRAALAIGTGYLVSIALPWGSHAYWILLTIVVVLRGSLAQTLERRNSRVAGTLLGCALAAGLIMLHLPVPVLLVCSSIAQALAHAFAVRRYLIAAVGATVLGLLQAHQLDAAAPPVFAGLERLADTLIGVAIAWGFSYVLPAWERTQIPRLVQRTLAAQARHAQVALGLGQLDSVDNAPELEWRLARREAYDALSALVQATQRSLAEPRAVRPPLDPLARLLAHGYQLLAQLTAVKTMLLLRRGRLKLRALREPLRRSGDEIEARLAGRARAPAPAAEEVEYPHALPDPSVDDLSPWALRRLALAEAIAERLRADADEVFDATGRPRTRSYGGPG